MDATQFESFINFLLLQAWAQSKFICQDDAFQAEKETVPPATQTHFRNFLRSQNINPSDGSGIGESVKYMPLYCAFGLHERYLLEKVYSAIDDPRAQVQAMFAFTVNRRRNVFDVLLPYLEIFGAKCFSPDNDTGAFYQVYNALLNLQSNGHLLGTEKGTYLHVPRYNEEERRNGNVVNVNYASGREAQRDISFDKMGNIRAVPRNGPARRHGITCRWLLASAHPSDAAKGGGQAVPTSHRQESSGKSRVSVGVAGNADGSAGDGTNGNAEKHFIAFCNARRNVPVTVCLREKGNFTRWLMRRMAEFAQLGGEVYDFLMARQNVKVMEICRFIAEINKRRMLNVGDCMEKIFVVSLHLRFPERKLLADECQVGSTNPAQALRLLFPKLRGFSAKDACAKVLRDHLMPRLRKNEKLQHVALLSRSTALKYATINKITCLYKAIASTSSTHLEAGDIQVNLCEWLKYVRDHGTKDSAEESAGRVPLTLSSNVRRSGFRPIPKCRQTIFRVGLRPVRHQPRVAPQRSVRPYISLLDDDHPAQQPRHHPRVAPQRPVRPYISLSDDDHPAQHPRTRVRAERRTHTGRQSELSQGPNLSVSSGPAVSRDPSVALTRVVHNLDSPPKRKPAPRLVLDLDSPTTVTAPPLSIRNLNLTLHRAVTQLTSISNTAGNPLLGRDMEVLLTHIVNHGMSSDKCTPTTRAQAHGTVCYDERVDDELVMQLHASLRAHVRKQTKGVEELIVRELCVLLWAYLGRQNMQLSGDCNGPAGDEGQKCADGKNGLSESFTKPSMKRSGAKEVFKLSTDPPAKRGKIVEDEVAGSSSDPPRKRLKYVLRDNTRLKRSIRVVATPWQPKEEASPLHRPAGRAPNEQSTTGWCNAAKMSASNYGGLFSSCASKSRTEQESAGAVSLLRRRPCGPSRANGNSNDAPCLAGGSRSIQRELPRAGARAICLFADMDNVESRNGRLPCTPASSAASAARVVYEAPLAPVSNAVSPIPASSRVPVPPAPVGPIAPLTPVMSATLPLQTSTGPITSIILRHAPCRPSPLNEDPRHTSSPPLNTDSALYEPDEPSRATSHSDGDDRLPCSIGENTPCGHLEMSTDSSSLTARDSAPRRTDAPIIPISSPGILGGEPACPSAAPTSTSKTKNITDEIIRPPALLIELLSPPTSPIEFFSPATAPSEFFSLPASPIELRSLPASPHTPACHHASRNLHTAPVLEARATEFTPNGCMAAFERPTHVNFDVRQPCFDRRQHCDARPTVGMAHPCRTPPGVGKSPRVRR